MKVAKFGGSSVASADQIKKVGAIIQSDTERKFIVVSAPGKRDAEDTKVTDLLINLGEAIELQQATDEIIDRILNRFNSIITELNLSQELLSELSNALQEIITDAHIPIGLKQEILKSFGEDSSAKVVSAYLNTIGLKARYMNPQDAGILVSDEPGNAKILNESYEKLFTLREQDGILVIPGFFGYTTEGKLITFSRGGSDITGSIVAAGVKAKLYENFTDVDSVFSVNPNIVNNPKEITTLTYREMRKLSYAGFSVFHDEALIPAFNAKIPVCIKNTNNPSARGTMIVAEKEPTKDCVVGIASDSGFASLYVSKYLMNKEIGFGRKLLQILEDEGISFEHAPSGIDDISIIIRERQLTPEKEEKILKRIKNELKADTVHLQRGLAVIMVVGEGMNSTVGVAQKATKALSEANVNIEMINQGSSEVSMMFGIHMDGLERAIRSLYATYFPA
ncbi:aspartate kinase [Ornithinibacillus sp. 4-3]|uniref:Aspartokinase n=1 Tax=Ornithinibacillus sp. 4-3 TaxID=3231488 RepID=A0AB39HKX0_9BACI